MGRYFELVERNTPKPNSGMIRTAALMCCGLCGDVIDTMGGPGCGTVCERCAVELKAGRLRGAVIWEEDKT